MIYNVAIAGQPTFGATMPDNSPTIAMQAVHALNDRATLGILFGFMRPLYQAHWRDQEQTLCVTCDRSLTRTGRYDTSICWQWAGIWSSDDWYEIGWHPDVNFNALIHAPASALWDVLNPGKRVMADAASRTRR